MGGATCDIISTGRTTYRYNPYMKSGSCKLYVDDLSSSQGPSSGAATPRPSPVKPARFYTFLDAKLSPSPVLQAVPAKSDMMRLFLGQLPFCVTDDELNYAISIATGGLVLHHIERIVNWKKGRSPTGCVHAYCLPSEVEGVLSVHQRVLFDEDGVWCASTEGELMALRDYAAHLKHLVPPRHPTASSSKMPTGLLSVEQARSTYVRDENFAVNSFVPRENNSRHHTAATANRHAPAAMKELMPAQFSGVARYVPSTTFM